MNVVSRVQVLFIESGVTWIRCRKNCRRDNAPIKQICCYKFQIAVSEVAVKVLTSQFQL